MTTPPAQPRRLVYLGTPEAAVPPLRALVVAGFDVALVISRPDKRRGRGKTLQPSPVKAAATELAIPVSSVVEDVLGVGADLGVVVAYGRLVKPHVLERLAMVNLHFSLLPRWRGAAPVERAILAGDTVTGVSLMALEEGLDTGPVYRSVAVEVGREETADELRLRLVELGSSLLVDTLRDGLGDPVPQAGEPTTAAKIDQDELAIDWTRPAVQLHRLVRVGGAFTSFRDRRFKVHVARVVPDATGTPGALDGLVVATGDGGLELVEVQPEGRARQDAAAWRNGARPEPGERLG